MATCLHRDLSGPVPKTDVTCRKTNGLSHPKSKAAVVDHGKIPLCVRLQYAGFVHIFLTDIECSVLHAQVYADSFKSAPFTRLLEQFFVIKIVIIIVRGLGVENEKVRSSMKFDI